MSLWDALLPPEGGGGDAPPQPYPGAAQPQDDGIEVSSVGSEDSDDDSRHRYESTATTAEAAAEEGDGQQHEGNQHEQSQPRGIFTSLCSTLRGATRAVTQTVPRVSAVTTGVASSLVGAVRDSAAFTWDLVTDVGSHWVHQGVGSIGLMRGQDLQRNMALATSYQDWAERAAELDRVRGNHEWKMRYESPDYNYSLLRARLEELFKARQSGDRQKMAFLLRSTLIRDLAGINNPKLYKRCLVGTKDLIEKYTDEVVYELDLLSRVNIPGLSQDQHSDLFVQIRQVYGRTALMLSGGGGLGVYHFGVVRALYETNLLPRIISGSSAGALFASLICTSTDDELTTLMESGEPSLRNPYLITREGEPSSLFDLALHFYRHGILADIETLKQACRDNIGDVTFQEAYARTHRILNITVNSRNRHEVPRLLNYLTCPNVVVWSAACASCALAGLFDPVEILIKDPVTGVLSPWNPVGQNWADGSVQSDLPMDRLTELFNVNHFIVSQVNPHVLPGMYIQRLAPRLTNLLSRELHYRIQQINSLRAALPFASVLRMWESLLNQTYRGDITIVPSIPLSEYLNIAKNPTPDRLRLACRVGQLATWPRVAQIRTQCKIELALDNIVARLRGCERWELT